MARTSRIQGLKLQRLGPSNQARCRDRIVASVGQFLPRLIACASGQAEMTPSQVRAATVLLNKVLPDLGSSDVTVHDASVGKTEAELMAELKASLAENPELRALLLDEPARH